MFKHLIALVLVALAAAFVSPAVAQQQPGTSIGTLACKMAFHRLNLWVPAAHGLPVHSQWLRSP